MAGSISGLRQESGSIAVLFLNREGAKERNTVLY